MLEIEEIELDNDGNITKENKDHTLYKFPDYKKSCSYDCIKNQNKLNFLKSRCMNLDIYPVKMIKLLLDGDYKNELNNYKSETIQFINEILQKKIPYTRLGIQTKLYKMIKDVKNGNSIDYKKKQQQKKIKYEEEEDDEDEDEIKDIETLKDTVLNCYYNGDREKAMMLLDEYLEPYDPLYMRLMMIVKN